MSSTISSLGNRLFRGTLYTVKKICSTTFLLCSGILLSFLIQLALENSDNKADDATAFAVSIFVLLAFSAIVWLIVRPLHNRWVKKQQLELIEEVMEQMNREGIITDETMKKITVRLEAI
jgi:membrane protein implicated in regulation of membrane protease activity